MRRVAVVEGDGIGCEVIPVAREVLQVLLPDAETFDLEVGCARWERSGHAITDGDLDEMRRADAILFGAVTTPPSKEYASVIVRIRKELDLYANLRPVRGRGFDISIVRENTEGLYSGIEEISEDCAVTHRVITRRGSERIARFACGLVKRGGHLTIGHKANVLRSCLFFRNICIDVAREAGVRVKECFIDALCLDILMHPERYDVIVTTNLFGDILSDVAAYLVGGLGMLPSANIGDRHALFEPVHGSAPDIAGKGIANPVAAVRSAAMLAAYLGRSTAVQEVESAIQEIFSQGVMTPDLGGTATTREFGDALLSLLRQRIEGRT
ncbi:MAG: isocitrate/isopropylmalate dehydrogenase family protein [Methanomicrobiales archaeon]|nr:isocitrate/isopropylmalate dehydrogenase family protein [Methanomicrobiales archaeon]